MDIQAGSKDTVWSRMENPEAGWRIMKEVLKHINAVVSLEV